MMPVGIMDSELGFSQTSAVFAQPKPFRTIPNLFGYNSLIEREIPSGSRAFPDEEGTESKLAPAPRIPAAAVPEPSPMKRGLKGRRKGLYCCSVVSSRAFPDEEGTERWEALWS